MINGPGIKTDIAVFGKLRISAVLGDTGILFLMTISTGSVVVAITGTNLHGLIPATG